MYRSLICFKSLFLERRDIKPVENISVEEQFLPRKQNSAFSLIELMLVLGVLALVSSLIIVNADSILTGLGEKPLAAIVRKAVREARYLAAQNKEVTYLSFDPETSEFLIADANNQPVHRLSTGYAPEEPLLQIDFYQILPGFGLSLQDSSTHERRPASRVAFHPDRSSTPFEIAFKHENEGMIQRYDPFSEAVLEEKPL